MGPSINLDPGHRLPAAAHQPPPPPPTSNSSLQPLYLSPPLSRVYIKRVHPIVAIPPPRAYVPSAAALAALRKSDKSVLRDGRRGEVEGRRRRRVINLGCSCVCGTSEAETCPAGHCTGQSALVPSCRLLLYMLVSHPVTVVCDLTSHASPSELNLVTFYCTLSLSPCLCALPPETLSAARAGRPSRRFQRSSRSLPKYFDLQHPLPYHICLDLAFMPLPWHRPTLSSPWLTVKVAVELPCNLCIQRLGLQNSLHISFSFPKHTYSTSLLLVLLLAKLP